MLAGKIGNGGWEEGEHVPVSLECRVAAHGKCHTNLLVSVNFDRTVMGRAWPAVNMSLNLTY